MSPVVSHRPHGSTSNAIRWFVSPGRSKVCKTLALCLTSQQTMMSDLLPTEKSRGRVGWKRTWVMPFGDAEGKVRTGSSEESVME